MLVWRTRGRGIGWAAGKMVWGGMTNLGRSQGGPEALQKVLSALTASYNQIIVSNHQVIWLVPKPLSFSVHGSGSPWWPWRLGLLNGLYQQCLYCYRHGSKCLDVRPTPDRGMDSRPWWPSQLHSPGHPHPLTTCKTIQDREHKHSPPPLLWVHSSLPFWSFPGLPVCHLWLHAQDEGGYRN